VGDMSFWFMFGFLIGISSAKPERLPIPTWPEHGASTYQTILYFLWLVISKSELNFTIYKIRFDVLYR